MQDEEAFLGKKATFKLFSNILVTGTIKSINIEGGTVTLEQFSINNQPITTFGCYMLQRNDIQDVKISEEPEKAKQAPMGQKTAEPKKTQEVQMEQRVHVPPTQQKLINSAFVDTATKPPSYDTTDPEQWQETDSVQTMTPISSSMMQRDNKQRYPVKPQITLKKKSQSTYPRPLADAGDRTRPMPTKKQDADFFYDKKDKKRVPDGPKDAETSMHEISDTEFRRSDLDAQPLSPRKYTSYPKVGEAAPPKILSRPPGKEQTPGVLSVHSPDLVKFATEHRAMQPLEMHKTIDDFVSFSTSMGIRVKCMSSRDAGQMLMSAMLRSGMSLECIVEHGAQSLVQLFMHLFKGSLSSKELEALFVLRPGFTGSVALCAARVLQCRGIGTTVYIQRSDDTHCFFEGFYNQAVEAGADICSHVDDLCRKQGVLIDGTSDWRCFGGTGDVDAEVVRSLAKHKGHKVSLEIPGGVDIETGDCAADKINAGVVVSFGFPKTGIKVLARRETVRVFACDIGLVPDVYEKLCFVDDGDDFDARGDKRRRLFSGGDGYARLFP